MSTTRAARQPRPKPAPAPPAPVRRRETSRDFVEQIVVAFILAFLVRGFEAEAFVIPTGSMAPTLLGMHKDIKCPECGFLYSVNASEQYDRRNASRGPIEFVRSATCNNCRAPVTLDGETSFSGDRILVMKYHFNVPWPDGVKPRRWEVIVFHYPEQPEVNYIKRTVGLPDEDLRIFHGDILTRPHGEPEKPYTLERKPLPHQDAMLMNVWDDRHRPKALEGRPEWQRWTPREPGAWSEPEPGRFVASSGGKWSELRYRHLIPDPAQWQALVNGSEPGDPPRPRLITDFYAYNSGSPAPHQYSEPMHQHWVGDLSLACRVDVAQPTGRLRFDLVKGGLTNRVEIDLQTGIAQLYHGNEKAAKPIDTPLKSAGSHEIRFANIDGRLTLWVDGQTPLGDGAVYQTGDQGYTAPTEADLEPVAIGSTSPGLVVSNLVLSRDIYYTSKLGRYGREREWDYSNLGLSESTILADPEEFPAIANVQPNDFSIQPRSYMMMGDNSPRSLDGRLWTDQDAQWDKNGRQTWEVPEALIIGKAFATYWPHGAGLRFKIPFLSPFIDMIQPQPRRWRWTR